MTGQPDSTLCPGTTFRNSLSRRFPVWWAPGQAFGPSAALQGQESLQVGETLIML